MFLVFPIMEDLAMPFKRIFKHILPLALMLTIFLTACGGSTGGSGSTSATTQNITITVWHAWVGDYLSAKQAIFDAYHKAHPNVTFKLVHQDDVIAKSITAVKANNGPDIIAYADDNLGKLASSNVVVPLDKYFSTDYVSQNFSKAAAEAVTFNGHVYGLPETVEAITFMYNKALIQASDLPKTTDEMLTFSKTYAQKNPGKYGVVWDVNNAYTAAAFYYGFGAVYVTPDGKAHLDTPEALAATKFIGSFNQYLPKQITYDVASSLFTEGKAAAIINGPWSYSDYANKAKLNIGFAPLPTVSSTNTPAKPFVGVKTLWVSKNAKDVATAADVIKFFTSKDQQVSMVKVTGEIPANTAAADDPTVTSNPAIAGYAAQAKLGTALPNTPYMSALWTPVQSALTAVWNKSQTPEQAMAAAQSAATKGIAQITS